MTEVENPNNLNPGLIIFKNSIVNLKNRAKKSRRKVMFIFIILFSFVFLFAALILYVQSVNNKTLYQSLELNFKNRNYSVEEPFLRQLNVLTDSLIGPNQNYSYDEIKFIQPNDSIAGKLKSEIIETLKLYEIAHEINRKEITTTDNTTGLTNIISSSVFSLGAVGFIILLIQISIMFMRYYSRLAELYEAQAEALLVSNGDSELAYKFIENFSPNVIELGKTPISLYEKALETIKEVARKP